MGVGEDKMKKYVITYCQDTIIDKVEARCPAEAIKRVMNPVFFQAVEIKPGLPKGFWERLLKW